MLLLLLCMLAWPRLAWPSLTDSSTHRKHTQNPNPSIPQVPKCTNSVYVLCFCKRSAKNWCFRKFTYATIEFATAPHLTLSSATPTAHYFSALQLSVNNSGIFGFKMQMHRQQLSTRCKLGLLRGRWGQIHHIYIHICRYIYIYICYIHIFMCMQTCAWFHFTNAYSIKLLQVCQSFDGANFHCTRNYNEKKKKIK